MTLSSSKLPAVAVVLIGLSVLAWTGSASAQEASAPRPLEGKTVYASSFRGKAGPQWSHRDVVHSPAGNRIFLGLFASDSVHLTLEKLPKHTWVAIDVDLIIIRSWDGNGADDTPRCDLVQIDVQDGPLLLHATFSNNEFIENIGLQSFPRDWPGPAVKGRTGAIATNKLGYTFAHGNHGIRKSDSVYRLRFYLPHDGQSLKLNFTARNLSAVADEAWGLDNVRVRVYDRAPLQATGKQMEAMWAELTGLNDVDAHRACWQFVGTGQAGLAFLRAKMGDGYRSLKQIRKIVGRYDKADFERRETVSRQLEALGPIVLPHLLQVWQETTNLEARGRVGEVIEVLGEKLAEEGGPAVRRSWATKALSVLEFAAENE